MNCEQVKERLSAYLDDMLLSDERRVMTIHLQACPRCMLFLTELRQNDVLLARLPRVSPPLALRERLFSTPEIRKLLETVDQQRQFFSPASQTWSVTLPHQDAHVLGNSSKLIALPGISASQPRKQAAEASTASPVPPAVHARPARSFSPQRRKGLFTPLKIALAAMLLVALATTGLFALSLRHQPTSANLSGAITPPAAGPGAGPAVPLAAGPRFVFLRDNALWSTLADGGNRRPERLTPTNVTVAPGWRVNPARGSHSAGNLLAYVDSQSAKIHIIRSDGQQDTPVQQTLLKTGSVSAWESVTGQSILAGLAWSPDSSMLAFVGDPAGSGRTGLYLYFFNQNSAREVATDLKGSISRPVWSPDGIRLAFTLTHDGVVSVLDYNVQSQKMLDLSNLAASEGTGANGVLTLGWSSGTSGLAVTWSLGSIGHIDSIWIRHLGASGTVFPQQLASGNYVQALYSPGTTPGTGGWLLVSTVEGRAGDIWRINLTVGTQPVPLSQGKQVGFARWSPSGSMLFYLDGQTNGVGSGHLVDVATGADRLLSDHVAFNPAPAWSVDSQQLAYSTGTRINIVNAAIGSQTVQVLQYSQATSLIWSPASAHQLVVVLAGSTPGIYLTDTQRNTALQLDHLNISGEIQWTEIP